MESQQNLREAQSAHTALSSAFYPNALQVKSACVSPRVAVLIPCYNELLTIAAVVRDFLKALPQAEIYVYDNNSTDGCIEALQQLLRGDIADTTTIPLMAVLRLYSSCCVAILQIVLTLILIGWQLLIECTLVVSYAKEKAMWYAPCSARSMPMSISW